MRLRSGSRSQGIPDPMAYLFIAPNLAIYGVFIFVPLMLSVGLSFTDYNLFRWSWVGARNYIRMFGDADFVASIRNTSIYSVSTIFPSMAIGLVLAVMLNERLPGRTVFRTAFYLPNVISVVASSLAWSFMLHSSSNGVANRFLALFGLGPVEWLADIGWALPSVIVMSIWGLIGFNMLVYLAGLQSIPAPVYEAATIDGASPVQQFFRITLPLLRPTTFFLFVISCIRSFQVFGQVYIMTGGGPLNSTTTIVHQIYQNGFQGYKMGFASAQAIFLLLLIFGLTLLNFSYGSAKEGGDVT